MEVMQETCNSIVDLVKFTLIKKKKKDILIVVTLLKATLSVTWQIMPIIKIKIDILNLSLISGIKALEKYKKEKEKEKLNWASVQNSWIFN